MRVKTGPHVIFIKITESGCKFQKISLIMVFLYLNQALLLNFEPFYVGLNGKLVACELRWVGVS